MSSGVGGAEVVGFAGSTAARALVRAGRSVIVLEARNRVGGRALNYALPGGEVSERGATFVGPTLWNGVPPRAGDPLPSPRREACAAPRTGTLAPMAMERRAVDAARERVLPRDGWRARLARDQLHAALKAVVATSVAWELGRLIGPAPVVYFAPITALVAIHPTIARSLRETLFYAASVVAGVLLAMGADAWAGTSLLGILLVVGVGVLLGAARPFGRNGSNIAFWALLVLLVGGGSPASYLSERLPEAALGLGVGVLVNVTVLPRTRLRPAGRLLDWLRTDLADVADAMAADLAQDWPPADPWWAGRDDELEQATQQARGAVGAATDSMRFNPRSRRRGRRPMERREHEVLEGLERIATAMRAIVRTLAAAAGGDDASAGLDQAFRKTYGGLLARLATPIREHGTGSRLALADVAHDLRELEAAVARGRAGQGRSWLFEALLLLELDQMHSDLIREDHEVSPRPFVATEAQEVVS